MKTQRLRHVVDFLFAAALFGVFLVSSVMVVAVGAGAYRSITGKAQEDSALRTSLSYVSEKLRQAGIQPTAMMDISDGLSSELLHICTQSKVGCRVYEEHIPLDYQTAVMAEELNMNVTTCALNGGEDYELLFTVPIADHEKVSEMEGVKLIGHITKPELGCALITRDGQEFELKAQGWNPLKETENGQE